MKTPGSKRDQHWDEDGLSDLLRAAREHAEPSIDQSNLNDLKHRLKAIPESHGLDANVHLQKSILVVPFKKKLVALGVAAAAVVILFIFFPRSVNLGTEKCTSFECMLATFTLDASDVSDLTEEETTPFNEALTGGLFAGLDDELLEEYLFDSNSLDDETLELIELE